MFKHFYAAKRVFMNLEMFLISSSRRIFTKLLAGSEISISKEARLCNIFKTENAITLAKTILESTYKAL